MNSTKQEHAIRMTLTRMEEMFVNPTNELFNSIFTADCDYITFDGRHLKGIQENYEAHRALTHLWLFKGVRLEMEVISLRLLNDQTAIAILQGALVFRWQKRASRSRLSINTNVLVNEGEVWKISSFKIPGSKVTEFWDGY
jgi:uncharacterized protein (TIGR02246 family)